MINVTYNVFISIEGRSISKPGYGFILGPGYIPGYGFIPGSGDVEGSGESNCVSTS